MTIRDKSNGSFKPQKLIVDCISFSYSEGAHLAPTNTFRTSIANFQLIVEHLIPHSEGEYIYSLDYEGA